MMRTGFSLSCVLIISVFMGTSVMANDSIQRIDQGRQPGASTAVVVQSERLIHTGQIFPLLAADAAKTSAVDQLSSVMDQARKSLAEVNAGAIVKLNLYVSSESVATDVLKALPTHFPENQPAVSLVVTKLPIPSAEVAADCVAVVTDKARPPIARSARIGELPEGSRIYVSGQAEQDTSLAVATRKTLESLRKTLSFLGRSDADIVQLKAFIQPMQDWKIVQAEVDAFYAEQPAVPLILVEWKSSTTVPIEIELIAGCRKERIRHADTVHLRGGDFNTVDKSIVAQDCVTRLSTIGARLVRNLHDPLRNRHFRVQVRQRQAFRKLFTNHLNDMTVGQKTERDSLCREQTVCLIGGNQSLVL